ncbi:FtsB family cell division protein [Sphingomonas sp.]|uniref:FtsB family cell division protein n=1 Tax=Sphingomonas sp. TaxID=28214 RepID=UPI002DD64DF0|nr:septum formation initiator family protein [Sphingomonas sp.]
MPTVRARHRTPVLTLVRRAGVPAGALILMGFFAYYAVLGPNGILSYRDYSRQLEKRQTEYAALDKQRAELKNRVGLLDPKRVNPDMADELTRKELNVVHPDEVIVPLN